MSKKSIKAKNEKVAVVLFNLGGPDSPQSVKPFLMNFFMDKNIISLPIPFRCFIAALIARKRSRAEAKESYDELGGSSPLLANSVQQANLVEKALNKDAKSVKYKSFICMRYWHPMAPQVVREVRDWGADRIVFLPLYPQFSTTTSWSSLENWDKHAEIANYMDVPRSIICCYPFQDGFIKASADHIYQKYQEAQKDGQEKIRFLFSAHGLPEDIIKSGDPYQWQCEQTAQRIVEVLQKDYGLDAPDWQVCYQSRVGPKKWIGPSLDQALEKAAQDQVSVIILPHAFTQEHVETLVELDVEYKEMAEELGIEGYYRANTVSTHPDFIAGLAKMVQDHDGSNVVRPEGGKIPCPENFDRCCMRSYEITPCCDKAKAA